jgi:8-oxo-dGTP pyrophosphatase MutT (NUDIX family)
MKKRTEVVCYFLCDDSSVREVLLGKKMQKTGQGKWNGYGGGQKPKESIIETVIREVKEELGVTILADDLSQRGFLKISIRTNLLKKSVTELSIFVVYEWKGDFQESSEMLTPTWWKVDSLPELIDSDWLWLPYILKDKKVEGTIDKNIESMTMAANIYVSNL